MGNTISIFEKIFRAIYFFLKLSHDTKTIELFFFLFISAKGWKCWYALYFAKHFISFLIIYIYWDLSIQDPKETNNIHKKLVYNKPTKFLTDFFVEIDSIVIQRNNRINCKLIKFFSPFTFISFKFKECWNLFDFLKQKVKKSFYSEKFNSLFV